MGLYANMVLTQQGPTLGKVQAGAELTFTRMRLGSGQLATHNVGFRNYLYHAFCSITPKLYFSW